MVLDFLAIDNFYFTRKIVDFFGEMLWFLDFLAIDNYDFTRKIVKKNLGEKLVRIFLKMSIKLAKTQGHFKNVIKTCQNYLFRRIFRRILPAADMTLLLEPLGIFSFKSGGLLDTLLSLGEECLLFNSVSSSDDSVMLNSLKFSGSGLLRT